MSKVVPSTVQSSGLDDSFTIVTTTTSMRQGTLRVLRLGYERGGQRQLPRIPTWRGITRTRRNTCERGLNDRFFTGALPRFRFDLVSMGNENPDVCTPHKKCGRSTKPGEFHDWQPIRQV